jgi:hypothetical protein
MVWAVACSMATAVDFTVEGLTAAASVALEAAINDTHGSGLGEQHGMRSISVEARGSVGCRVDAQRLIFFFTFGDKPRRGEIRNCNN